MTDDDRELRVSKIRNGTVIDHLTAGEALNVLAILDIDGSGGEAVSIGMNVSSDRLGRKDIVKVEDRELSQSEVDVLAVVAPKATINIVRTYDVIEKSALNGRGLFTGCSPVRTEIVSQMITSQSKLNSKSQRMGYDVATVG